ncbi:hypothetical protein CSKR_102878 [Clonorchis sinensis]|uniref:Uncharacterized protein n=1 Tax=Clonorchis sinensis TaxID=79923 RepID=A0A419Q2X0_CLOSI|nr:hypothetical protein CSKR_102878 [Clonorchis sinensis]
MDVAVPSFSRTVSTLAFPVSARAIRVTSWHGLSGSNKICLSRRYPHEFTDRKVRDLNPTSASRLPLSRREHPGSIPPLVLPSGGMALHSSKLTELYDSEALLSSFGVAVSDDNDIGTHLSIMSKLGDVSGVDPASFVNSTQCKPSTQRQMDFIWAIRLRNDSIRATGICCVPYHASRTKLVSAKKERRPHSTQFDCTRLPFTLEFHGISPANVVQTIICSRRQRFLRWTAIGDT